ncbi:MAG: hypothetical protein P4L73_19140 [Caulobacteraceae bacterium]|nr:hypothetical protein [Caulobacteraceae bacterium]
MFAERSDLVDLALACHRETDKAWRLSKGTADEPQWLPKSMAERGEGLMSEVWTMPRWIARDRGWL